MKKVLLFFGLFIFFGGKIVAQSSGNNIVLYSVTEANGLSDNHVRCVLKDKSDLVWIGTADGLNVIDGSSIIIFRHHNNDSASLISNDVLCLAEDTSENIWIGTFGGLSVYNKEKRSFSSFLPPLSPYGSAIAINTIIIDKNQRIWCCTDGGLLLFDANSKKFIPYYNTINDKKSSIIFRNKLTNMIADHEENKLWLASSDGVWSFDLSNLSFKNEIGIENDFEYQALFTYVYQSKDGKIWLGNWGNGLESFDKRTGKIVHYHSPKSTWVIKCIHEVTQADGKNVLWLDGDLLAFDPSTNSFFNYSSSQQASESLNTFPCYESKDGWIWLASSSGLYIYDPQRQFFQHHLFPGSITSQTVILSNWNDQLVVGGQSENFLKLYDKNWNVKKNLSSLLLLPNNGNAEQQFASTLALSIQGNNFWIANSAGIVKTNIETNRSTWYRHKNGDSTSLPRNFIAHIFFDSQKKLWVFPWREGIWTMDTLTGKLKKLWAGFSLRNEKIKNLLIAATAEDKNGNIWMADLDEGIVLYERKTNSFSKPFVKQTGETAHTSSVFYKNGFLYTAIGSSLIRWNENERKLRFFDLPQEMSKEILDICPDKKNNWWIATTNGLVVFNETDSTFQRFTVADGLANNEMNGTLYCEPSGNMLFASPTYVTSFDPAKILSNISTIPHIRLEEIVVNDRSFAWDGRKNLQFDYRSKNIFFKWALPDFSNPFHNLYYCMLKGIDADWRYLGNKGEVQYANLSPGKYTIQLKAASANGVTSSNIITINFEIKPPFWKTTWFIILLSIALITIFGLIVRYISQRNLKEKLLRLEKEQAVEKERNRISHDMHDDLGSGLTKIAIMSEVVKKQISDPEKATLRQAQEQLDTISTSSRELVDSLQDIIWVLNPKNDTLESLASYIREHTLKFFEPLSIETKFYYPEKFASISLSEEKRRNIFLTVKESLNNISKHAWCNKVELIIENKNDLIRITIRDDGKGFDVNKVRTFANGLINMKNRIEQIGGKYEIRSEEGKGTTTIIEVAS